MAVENRLNQRLEGSFGRKNDYDCVKVLALYWEDADQDFEQEALKITEFFENLGYTVQIFPIPTLNCEVELTDEINRFLLEKDPSRSLHIIHYGGHGDEDSRSVDRRRQSVWAAWQQGGPLVRWSSIQPRLAKAGSDVLLILDCCYGAQAARDRNQGRLIPDNVELLAACPMGRQTNGPGPFSFTSKFIEEAKARLKDYGCVKVSDLHARLLEAGRRAPESSVRVALAGRKESVRLERLEKRLDDPKPSLSAALSLNLEIAVSRDPTSDLLDEITEWLKDRPPRSILRASFTEISLDSQPLRGYICQRQGETSITGYEQLSETSKQDVRALWISLGTRLKYAKSFLSSVTPGTITAVLDNGETSDNKLIFRDIQDLKKIILALQSTINRSVQAIPALDDQKTLSQAVEETTLNGLQAEDTLKVRRLASSPLQHGDSSTVLPNVQAATDPLPVFQSLRLVHDGARGDILIEYKYSEHLSADREHAINADRMHQLVLILQAPNPDDYGTLQCLGWSPEPKSARDALHFQIPPGCQNEPITLREVIKRFRRVEWPTLGQKFAIAKSIGQALRKWHLAGWVHQGITSYNIVFFRGAIDGRVDYSKPYLCGFDYTRVVGKQSSERHPSHMVREYELYRHPSRQGNALITHQKEHDLYSYGLLLLEIGRWVTVAQDFFSKSEELRPMDLRDRILKRASGLLKSTMGETYEDAVMTCVRGNFRVMSDDKSQSRLDKAFEDLVLNKIPDGREVDAPTNFY